MKQGSEREKEREDMEIGNAGTNNFGGSLKVENVQELASKGLKKNIPPRYIRDELEFDEISFDESQHLLIINMENLDNIDESTKLHRACKDWGFFQLVNHGISEVVEEMKVIANEFFKLSQEQKMEYSQLPGAIEGYGHLNVFSEDQKLDWGDMLAMWTRPIAIRNMRYWPTSPISFRSALDAYSHEMERVKTRLLRVIAKNLGIDPNEFLASFENGIQAIRVNYYPPCELASKVIGFTPHSDASALTLLVQVNDVQGLQIKKSEKWVPVKPIPGAIIVNIGDVLEIMSNGEYSSVEHRAMVNTDKERMSIAAFHNPNLKAMVGPIPCLLTKTNQVAKYKTIGHEDYLKLFASNKLDGKSLLDHMRSA